LKQEYGDQPKITDYLDAHKYPKRKEFVKAWSSKVKNFGHNVTSRGEAGHHYLKSFLEGNHHDLLELKDRVQASIEVFIANFKRDLAMKRDRLRSDLDMRRWKEYCDPDLNHQIVPKGLELLLQQLRLAKDPLIDGRCSGLFESANGIPCYHSIRTLHDFKRKVTSAWFHKHWHFDRPVHEPLRLPPPPPPAPRPSIFPPRVVRTRGRPSDRSTRRLLSQFEVTAGTAPAHQQRRPGRVGGEDFAVRLLL
jgi:hypothetical protein